MFKRKKIHKGIKINSKSKKYNHEIKFEERVRASLLKEFEVKINLKQNMGQR